MSIGDGILLRVVLWVLLTAMSVAWVLRYAAKVRRAPEASLVGWEDPKEEVTSADEAAEHLENGSPGPSPLTRTQKWVLVVTALAFGLMIFSVIPWSSILGASTGPADYLVEHDTTAQPYWFELGWWFPQLAMLFVLASVVVGIVARMGEQETVRLIAAGASDIMAPPSSYSSPAASQ